MSIQQGQISGAATWRMFPTAALAMALLSFQPLLVAT